MGSKKILSLIWLMFYVFLLPYVQGQNMYDDDSLDSFIRDYSLRRIGIARTGILCNISLPTNFSGVEASVVRIRSSSLWQRGANFSFFNVPPMTLPRPFSKRIVLVYQNLGNLSSFYYNVPNYTFIAPVIGLLAYDTNISSGYNGSIELNLMKDPILVRFPQISLSGATNVTTECVRFYTSGKVEFSNVTEKNSCIAWGEGHFSIVIPSAPIPAPPNNPNAPIPPPPNKRKQRLWKWWEIGFATGIVGLFLLVGFGILLYKLIRKKRIGRMEKESERSEALNSIWVGTSRMPSATGIRTQPVLENSYVP